jgi:hypothetical protein
MDINVTLSIAKALNSAHDARCAIIQSTQSTPPSKQTVA